VLAHRKATGYKYVSPVDTSTYHHQQAKEISFTLHSPSHKKPFPSTYLNPLNTLHNGDRNQEPRDRENESIGNGQRQQVQAVVPPDPWYRYWSARHVRDVWC
jgi:hypothetical protein